MTITGLIPRLFGLIPRLFGRRFHKCCQKFPGADHTGETIELNRRSNTGMSREFSAVSSPDEVR